MSCPPEGANKVIAVASDHAGFSLKELVCSHLEEKGFFVLDCGTTSEEPIDYPDLALAATRAIVKKKSCLGILICGTGIGMSIAANKVRGIRAALCQDCFSASAARRHNDANVLALGARVVGSGLALMIVDAFLNSSFEAGRHRQRIKKICRLENPDCLKKGT